MTRIVYVNGRYTPYADAAIHVEDRGFQFADGVYEVCEVRDGSLVDERRHMRRLGRSLRELGMTEPVGLRSLGVILRETIRRNRVKNGLVYLQVTRGVASRDFAFPGPAVAPSIVCFARSLSRSKAEKKAAAGISVITVPDIRWKRVDIKTTGLLAQALARQQAKEAGADEAWMVDGQGFVTEGASCNAWIVTGAGNLVTRPAEFWYPARHNARGCDGSSPREGASSRGKALHGRGGEIGEGGFSNVRFRACDAGRQD